jgi:hypothetical protein
MLRGSLMDENRKLLTDDVQYVQNGSITGWAVYTVAVDREGNVTSASLKDTDLKRTSAKFQIRNYLMTLKFEKGNHFPKFHHVDIKITLDPSLEKDHEE